MDQQNRYTPPNSDTSPQSQSGEKPSIEEALSRGYHFGIGEVISKAWKKTKGFKLKLLIAHMIFFGSASLLERLETSCLSLFLEILAPSVMTWIYIISDFLCNGILTVIMAGIIGMTLNHCRNQPVEIGQVFKYFALLFVPIFVLGLVLQLPTTVGILFLSFSDNDLSIAASYGILLSIIPIIYLWIVYVLSIWVLIDNQALSFWDAMEASRKAITQHWFKFFFLILVLCIINIIAAIPLAMALYWVIISLADIDLSIIPLITLGISIFWTIPLSFLSIAVVYERIFGAR